MSFGIQTFRSSLLKLASPKNHENITYKPHTQEHILGFMTYLYDNVLIRKGTFATNDY
jgi:hypothetical protein